MLFETSPDREGPYSWSTVCTDSIRDEEETEGLGRVVLFRDV